MREIFPHEVTPAIVILFDLTKPTMPRAFNVLEGISRGQIVVGDEANPTWAVVRDGTYGTLYFGGHVEGSLVASIVDKFRLVGEVGIGCWPDDDLNNMIPSTHEYDGRTLYFTERVNNNGLLGVLPPGYTLKPRDQSLLTQSFDYQSTLDAFGSIEAVMQNTLGIDILYEGQVVCEAATGAPTHGKIEVGVTTHEEHRQRGLATIACAHLIHACEEKGLKTWWDCAKQNAPSVKLARKLGYRNEQEYRYVWWKKKEEQLDKRGN